MRKFRIIVGIMIFVALLVAVVVLRIVRKPMSVALTTPQIAPISK